MEVVRIRTVVCALLAGVLLSMYPPPRLSAAPLSDPAAVRSVMDALAAPDGTSVTLRAVLVSRVSADAVYVEVRDSWDGHFRLAVVPGERVAVHPSQTVDVSGVMGTLASGRRVVLGAVLEVYRDSRGEVVLPPVAPGMAEDGTLWRSPAPVSGVGGALAGLSLRRLEEEPQEPAGGSEAAAVRRCNTLDEALVPPLGWTEPDGWRVSLTCRPISGVQPGWFWVGEESAGCLVQDLKVYCSRQVSEDDRVILVSGTIRVEGASKVLVVDARPGQMPETFAGTLLTAPPGSIAFALSLPDGAAVTLQDKYVSRGTPWENRYWVQEPDRSVGIRVEGVYGALFVGHLVALTGYLGTDSATGERVIYSQSEIEGAQSQGVQPLQVVPRLLGSEWFHNAATGAGQAGVDGRDGLSPTGLLVRTAGRVTHSGKGFVYLDDGSGLRDETEWSGIRVVLADTGRILQGDDVCITGIAGLRRDTLGRVWPVVRVEPADQAANDDDLVVLCPAGGSLTLTATPYAVAPGGSAQVTAEVRDRDGNPWNNVVVDFSTTLGVIAAPHGFVTDENGQVVVTLSEVAEGAFAIVTATAMPCRELLSNRLQVDFLQSLPDDWPMFQHDERRQGFSRFNDTDTVIEDALELVWSGQVPTATLSAAPLETLPIHDSSPVHAAGCPVIVGAFQGSQGDLTAATGYVVAFEPNPPNPGPNMPPVWRYPAGSAVIGGVASTPAIFQSGAEKRVVFGSTDGKVYCLNALTGGLIWVFQTLGRTNQPAPVVASPVVYEGMVYLGNVEGRLYCLDGSTTDPGGQMVWSFDLEPYSPGLMSVTPMTIGFAGPEVRLYVGCENHRLYCLSTAANPANRMIWSFTANQAIFAAPSFYAGNVYFGCATSTTENLYCLNAESGFVMWTRRLDDEVRATPATSEGRVTVGDDTGELLYQCDAGTGSLLNRFNAREHRPLGFGIGDFFLSSPVEISSGLIFVGNDNYAFYALRSLDLGHLTSVGTGGEVRSSPAVSYACQPGYRWIFVTTKASGGLLLAVRQPIDQE